MANLSLSHVNKVYDNGFEAVKDFNLEIEDKEFIIFIGPSGCGKSTTLRMIAGLEDISSGELKIDGKVMNDVEPKDRDIAMVFQNYAIYPTMTVYGNIEFGLKNAGIKKEERKRRIEEIGKITGLEEYMTRKPNALSGGQRQRVALARAMVKNPQVFLMDEPLSNLDAKLRTQLRTELIELHQKLGSTFVYVTHDQVEAMSMGTNIVLMHQGRIMQQGTPEKIYGDPDNVFTARFIGTPPMNIIETMECPQEWSDSEKAVYLGFRPEHVSFREQAEAVCMEGRVMTREMLGSEILYKLQTQYGIVQAKDYHSENNYSGDVRFWIPRRSICCFDIEENRIR